MAWGVSGGQAPWGKPRGKPLYKRLRAAEEWLRWMAEGQAPLAEYEAAPHARVPRAVRRHGARRSGKGAGLK